MTWGSPVERERKRRINIALWAYAYEFESISLVSDAEFDRAALEIDLSIDTGRPDLDAWFRGNFEPHTGCWVHTHPELEKLRQLYVRLRDFQPLVVPPLFYFILAV